MKFNLQKNILHYYVDLLRMDNNDDETSNLGFAQYHIVALYNILLTMSAARKKMICGEDLSKLNFGNIPLNGFSFSLDGNAASCFDYSIFHEWNFMCGHHKAIISVDYTTDEKYILSKDADCSILWDSFSGNMVKMISCPNLKIHYTPDKKLVSPDNRYYLAFPQSEHRLSADLCSTETHNIIHSFKGHTAPINAYAYSKDGRYCLTGSDDCTIKIWETSSGRCVRTLGGYINDICEVAISEDGQLLMIASRYGDASLWDTEIGKCIQRIKGDFTGNNKVLYSSNARYRIQGSILALYSTTVKMLDTLTGEYVFFRGSAMNSNAFKSFVYSPDNQYRLNLLSHYGHLYFSLSIYDKEHYKWEGSCRIAIDRLNIQSNKQAYFFPYIVTSNGGKCELFKINCTALEIEYIGTYYYLNGLDFTNCSFHNIKSDEATYRILFQYGATI